MGALGGLIGGAIYGYGSQVVNNLNQGMGFGQALITDISETTIALYAGVGTVIGAGVAPLVAPIASSIASGVTAGSAAATAACSDGDCTNEVLAIEKSVDSISSSVSAVKYTSSTSTSAIQSYYPPNLGFSGQPQVAILQTGTLLDRYGSAFGQFLSPAGTSNWARALPPGVEKLTLNTYIVTKPIENVLSGPAAPWFGQIGGGIQFFMGTPYGQNVQSLINSGYLSQIK